MLCLLIGHAHINEVQTVAQLFFPNVRFTFSSEPGDIHTSAGYAVLSRLENGGCFGEVYRDGRRIAADSAPAGPVSPCRGESGAAPAAEGGYLTEKRRLMLAMFKALKQILDIPTPWGALTGIRPSKMIRGWLAEGKEETEIISVLVNEIFCAEDKARLAMETARAEISLIHEINKKCARPLALYISIPFCPSRCLYCSFNTSHKVAGEDAHTAYLSALEAELRRKMEAARAMGGGFTAVYIGGGTPTVLSEANLEKLMRLVQPFLAMDGVEFTVEAGRPDSLTPGKLKILKDCRVTRVAVNPQTLSDRTLAGIGRSHTAADFFRAFEAARAAGFDYINTDIIAGLPGESPEDMRRTLREIIALRPENVTVHTLAVKRGSRLNERIRGGEPFESAPGGLEEMLAAAYEMCRRAGLRPYYLYRQKNAVGLFENVGYSREGYECLYNIGMMAEVQTVLGAGAGAVSKYVAGSHIERAFNAKEPEIYIKRMKERL